MVAYGVRGLVHDALHDVILPNGQGGLTQIDHLLLTAEGILVVETKSFTERIFGRQKESHWTQCFGRKSYKIANPLRQNYGHIQAVKELVGSAVPIEGVVVIAGSAKFPKGRPEGVVSRHELRRKLRANQAERDLLDVWMVAWKRIVSEARTDVATRKEHRAQLRNRFQRDVRPRLGLAMIAAGFIFLAIFLLG